MAYISSKSSEVRSLLAKGMREIWALALMSFSMCLMLAFASSSPTDPSVHLATAGDVQNWLGEWGADWSSTCLQLFGQTSYLLTFFTFMLGVNLLHRGRTGFLWRMPLFAIGWVLCSFSADLWDMSGAVGDILDERVHTALSPYMDTSWFPLFHILTLVWGSVITFAACGGSLDHLRQIVTLLSQIGYGFNKLIGWIRHPRTIVSKVESVRKSPSKAPAKALKTEKVIQAQETAPTPRKRIQAPQSDEEYQLPPLDILHLPKSAGRDITINEAELEAEATKLEAVLKEYGIRGEIVQVRPGPVVTLFELEPAPGLKSSRVIGLSDDIARSMSAISARVAVIPGKNVIGIELPNERRETVHLRELLDSQAFESSPMNLALALGKDISGAPVIADLSRMPHLLVAGTTGSGKSVGVNAMILSLLYRHSPDRCKFIMIDPKMLELSIYDGIPHLLAPVVTDPKKAVVALKWVVREMESRYQIMSKMAVRNIEGYNQRIAEGNQKGEVITRRVQTGFDPDTGSPQFEDQELDMNPLPFIVVVVDEMADLMLVAGKDIEMAVQRLAQMARAAGIHLIMATQRPSVDVITGTIKANFPTRISFQVTSKIDSRTILGESGGEQLLGQGDMLYMAAGGRISRVHGPYVGDEDVRTLVEYLKSQRAPQYVETITVDEEEENAPGSSNENEGDDLYDKALALVYSEGKASTSFIQRHLQIGYNRAARLIERMEKDGIVSPANHVGKREVLARTAKSA